MGKAENFEKVRKWVKLLKTNAFTSNQVEKEFNLGYVQVKPILESLEELKEVKYLQSTKLWVKINDENGQ